MSQVEAGTENKDENDTKLLLVGPSSTLLSPSDSNFGKQNSEHNIMDDPGLSISLPPQMQDVYSGTERKDRVADAEKLNALVLLISFVVSLSNIWRFSYYAVRYGGGAFLIAYLLTFFVIALPMLLLELTLGFTIRHSTVKCFQNIHPRWAGVGVAAAGTMLLCAAIGIVFLALSLRYAFESLQSPFPWDSYPAEVGPHRLSHQLRPNTHTNQHDTPVHAVARAADTTGSVPHERYLLHAVLGYHQGSMAINTPSLLPLAIGVGAVSFLATRKLSTKASIAAGLAPLPAVLLVVALLRAVTLPGAQDGLVYMVRMDSSALATGATWAAAASQSLLALGSVGTGCMFTVGRMMRTSGDVYRATLLAGGINLLFTTVGMVAVFAALGNLAAMSNTTVEAVAERSGIGVFLVALSSLPGTLGSGREVFSLLMFAGLVISALPAPVMWIEAVANSVGDVVSDQSWWRLGQWTRAVLVMIVLGAVCLLFATECGIDLVDMVDHRGVTMLLLAGAGVELLILRLDYHVSRLERRLFGSTEIGIPDRVWSICWLWCAPAMLLVTIVASFYEEVSSPYRDLPRGNQIIGWLTYLLIIVAVVFICANVYQSLLRDKTLITRMSLADCRRESLDGARSPSSRISRKNTRIPFDLLIPEGQGEGGLCDSHRSFTSIVEAESCCSSPRSKAPSLGDLSPYTTKNTKEAFSDHV